MKAAPSENGGCLQLISAGSKAFMVSLPVAIVLAFVGGNEMRGVALAFFATPMVFLFSLMYFVRPPRRKPTPLQKLARPRRPK